LKFKLKHNQIDMIVYIARLTFGIFPHFSIYIKRKHQRIRNK